MPRQQETRTTSAAGELASAMTIRRLFSTSAGRATIKHMHPKLYPERGNRMEREEWLKAEIERIKAGGTIQVRCTMSTPERVAAGWCSDYVPDGRAHRGSDTCSDACRNDKKRLRRWETSKGNCRLCNRRLPKPRKAKGSETGFRNPEMGSRDGVS
jgi:hypothetical protein